MRLRIKLLLLVHGILMLDIMVIALVGYVNWENYNHRFIEDKKTGYSGIKSLEKSVIRIIDDKVYDKHDMKILAIFDNSNNFLYMNKEFENSIDYKSSNLENLILNVSKILPDREIRITPFKYKNYSGLVLSSSGNLVNENRKHEFIFIPAIILLIISFILPAIFGPYIINDLRKTLSKLEQALNSVVEGDLDFELEVSDRNDLSHIIKSINLMKNRLKEEERSRRRFFQAVSHDLKTPLTSIIGYVEAIQDGIPETQEEYDEYYRILIKKIHILENRISSLIDYVSFDSKKIFSNFKEYSAKEIFEEMIDMENNDIRLFGKKFVGEINLDKDYTISCDKRLFIRCFENIFNNAVNYSSDDAIISLKVFVENGKLIVYCHNTGSKIDKELLPNIFEPFSREDKTRNTPGFGLGLASVKLILELHNGEISVENRDGVLFIIKLPLVVY